MKKTITLLLVFMLTAVILLSAATAIADFTRAPKDNAIAYITTTYKCGCVRAGTGTMISRYAMLTAAHMLFCPEHMQANEKIDILFGYQPDGSYFHRNTSQMTSQRYEGFVDKYNAEVDIAYIAFKDPVGDLTGWYPCEAISSFDQINGKVCTIETYNWTGDLIRGRVVPELAKGHRLRFEGTIYQGHWGGGPLMVDGKVAGVYIGNNTENSYAIAMAPEMYNVMDERGLFAEEGGTPPERRGSDSAGTDDADNEAEALTEEIVTEEAVTEETPTEPEAVAAEEKPAEEEPAGEETEETPAEGEDEAVPEEEEMAVAFDFGCSFMDIQEGAAERFGFTHGGVYAFDLKEGSVAAEAGLAEGDLIYSVNGVLWTDDAEVVDRAMTRLASGESMTFTVERPGKGFLDLTVNP